jgi:endonuclease/exonuclease/phosphatase family metal-dependent hydrolase
MGIRESSGEVVIATYNVEALFDCKKDHGTLDDEYLPHGYYAWTPEKLAKKVENLARVVRAIDGGRGPDVLALNEVENRGVVEELRAAIGDDLVTLAHHEGEDIYGLENAVLSRYPLAGEATMHHLSSLRTEPKWRMRGILEVPLDVEGAVLYVFANHWPAGVGRSAAQRVDAARQLRALIEQRTATDPGSKIVVLGDFNANPSDEAFGPRGLGVSADIGSMNGATLYNTMAWGRTVTTLGGLETALKAANAGTHFTRPPPYDGPDGEWNVLDHILVSPGLLAEPQSHPQERLAWMRGSTCVVREAFMLAADGTPRSFFERGVKPRDQDMTRAGFSDHLPVITRLTVT